MLGVGQRLSDTLRRVNEGPESPETRPTWRRFLSAVGRVYGGGDLRETTPDRWLWVRAPVRVFLGGAVLMAAVGVAFVLANPAGISTTSEDAYGPNAPLQPWVVLVAAASFACAACSAVLAVLVIYRRFHPPTEPVSTCEPAFAPLEATPASEHPLPGVGG
jgi:hypothetical protein